MSNELIERLRMPKVTFHQVNEDWQAYKTVRKEHAPPEINLEAADAIEKLLAQLESAESERDALKARIESAENREPLGYLHVNPHPAGGMPSFHFKKSSHDNMFPVWDKPIPSPDTQELIRKAVEEERAICEKICDDNYSYPASHCARLIRSRKEK